MRTAKILALVLGGLLGVMALVLLGIWLLVNPNAYKPNLVAAVKKATGRDLQLEGDLKLSVFPWIALQMGPASLGNPPGFSAQPFVSFTHAAVRVKLLPLLSHRLEIGRVELAGLDLALARNADGRGNWEGFGHAAGAAPPAATHSGGGEQLTAIEGIKISDARVTYEKLALTQVALETGSFAGKGVVPVTLHVAGERGVANEHASLDMRFDLGLDVAAQRYHVAALDLNVVANRAGGADTFTLKAPAIDVDLAAQHVSAVNVAANLAGAELTASVQGTHVVDAPEFTGNFTLAPLVLREVASRVGVTLPVTRDPKALSRVAASADFAYTPSAVNLEHLKVTLDDTGLTGSLGLKLASGAMTFALAVDSIDLDRYLPPPTPAAPAADGHAATPPAAAEASKPIDANGTLSVRSLHFAPLDLTNVAVTVATQDKVLHVFPLKAQVDGGQYSGDLTLDNRTHVPAVSMDEHLTGVDVGKLLATESKNLHVSGHGNVTLKATAHGVGADAMTKSLNGRFELNVADGAVEGVDLGLQLARAEALIGHRELPNIKSDGRTKFDAFKMTADIADGVATTRDLLIASAVLKVTGQGSVNLPAKTLDVSLLADTLRSAGGTQLQVPVKVSGSMADPTIRPDVAALAKGQLKQKVQDVVQDKLKGLFGR